jgi:type IV pilus assembly protein PilB
LIKHAILQDASDIHIEPDEKEFRVRYRIDGILHDAMTLPIQVQQGIIARIKVLSNLKLDEHRIPQDGRFKIEKDGMKISFRVSILPIFNGEKIVMRLLNESSKGLTLEQMGVMGRGLEIIHRHIKKPNGMILVTGPTGSGKTTTLYTIMDILNTPEVNISTVEDPVEYRMPRINQTQIYPKVGLTFAAGLRALLRQDPDIIMVGEIRDNETMEMAIHSAMTGHLVLSTLHTNSAAGTLPRLLDMGAEPFLLASTINVIVAQRLVRRLCSDCRKESKLSNEELKNLQDNYDMDRILDVILIEQKTKDGEAPSAKGKNRWNEIKFYKAVGCEQCNKEGYKGRLGIYEVLEVDDDIQKMISQKAPAEEIEKAAKNKGMLTMVEDGFNKAAQGMTSIEEILRVTRE